MKSARPPALCPVCGDAVPAGASACPTCGACERSGWNRDDDDDDRFDYDEFVAAEFGGNRGAARPAAGWFWWGVALAVLLALVALATGAHW